MIFQRFSVRVTIRVLLLAANIIVLAAIFGDKRLFFSQIILALLLIVQVAELVRFINHTNRELAKFLYAIRHSDFSITFKQAGLGSSFHALESGMAEIIAAYKQAKIEKEAQFHFLQMLVSQLHVGIIALRDENITLINPTAEIMTGIRGLKNWKIFQQHNAVLAGEIEQLGDQGRKLVELKSTSETRFISVDVRTQLILDEPVKLITLQDINSEIEQKEIEAWHKLIRILTHEIMNSVTPISSLTETLQGMLLDKSGNQKQLADLHTETISDIRFSLNTIQKRSDGLLHFIDNYRKLTKVPKPVRQKISLRSFLGSIEMLMSPEVARKNISLVVSTDGDPEINADPVLIEQVVINLATNSIQALENREHPQIALSAYRQERQTIIEVKDNGKGIPARELGEIFIPFFSTRKEGSGIGLSLSKQIMSLHGGTIKVRSEAGVGTTFLLCFNTSA